MKRPPLVLSRRAFNGSRSCRRNATTLRCKVEWRMLSFGPSPRAGMSNAETMAMLEKRRIEAAILKHVYETLKASHGVEAAQRAIAEAVRRSAMEQAGEM